MAEKTLLTATEFLNLVEQNRQEGIIKISNLKIVLDDQEKRNISSESTPANLEGFEISHVVFSGCDLSYAHLNNTLFNRCILNGANLSDTTGEVYFKVTDASNAKLNNLQLYPNFNHTLYCKDGELPKYNEQIIDNFLTPLLGEEFYHVQNSTPEHDFFILNSCRKLHQLLTHTRQQDQRIADLAAQVLLRQAQQDQSL